MDQPYATVDAANDLWMPRGLLEPAEARLGQTRALLQRLSFPSDLANDLTNWWLKRVPGANTPNWDIVSTCSTEHSRGLILVEAKAHAHELSEPGKSARSNAENHEQIRIAITEANAGLNAALPGWALSHASHYQIANRFAWAWKLAQLGVPVVLVYLGFLDAEDVADVGAPLQSADQWRNLVRQHTHGTVPEATWEYRLDINGTSLMTLIRSAIIRVEAL